MKSRLSPGCCGCSVAAEAGAASAVGIAPEVLGCTLGGARVRLGVSGRSVSSHQGALGSVSPSAPPPPPVLLQGN